MVKRQRRPSAGVSAWQTSSLTEAAYPWASHPCVKQLMCGEHVRICVIGYAQQADLRDVANNN